MIYKLPDLALVSESFLKDLKLKDLMREYYWIGLPALIIRGLNKLLTACEIGLLKQPCLLWANKVEVSSFLMHCNLSTTQLF